MNALQLISVTDIEKFFPKKPLLRGNNKLNRISSIASVRYSNYELWLKTLLNLSFENLAKPQQKPQPVVSIFPNFISIAFTKAKTMPVSDNIKGGNISNL